MPTRRAPRRRRRPAAVAPPAAPPGQRVWVLDLPYKGIPDQPAGVTYNRAVKANVWIGARPPKSLGPYLSKAYTYERMIEDDLNGRPGPAWPNPPTLTPRPLQIEAARAIARHAHAGLPQFVLADEPGVGKTLSAVLGARAVAKLRGAKSVLVIADRPSQITIGHWCRTIAAAGDGGLRWCVITWDRLSKVTDRRFDIVIADEAQMLRHVTTKRWGKWCTITGARSRNGKKPYLLVTTATPGHSPLELTYLAPAYAHRVGEDPVDWVEDFPGKLAAHGLHIRRGQLPDNPKLRAIDRKTVRSWLENTRPPSMLYRPAPWGPCDINGLPVTLTPAQQASYESDWLEFCAEMALAAKGRNAARGRAALLRFRQKAGRVRVDITVEWVQAQIAAGRQVAVSTQFVDAAAAPISDQLEDLSIPVARIYGQGGSPEAERVRFQTGRAPVVVFTPTASISLHSGEALAADRKATTAPRVGLFHQPRYSGIQGRQITGRTHRDHQRSNWYVAYGEGTVEEQIAKVMIERYAATSELVGGDTGALKQIAHMLNASWLPVDSLVDE